MHKAVLDARLNDERALIFRNLLNGVPVWRVARDFKLGSEQEVQNIFNFVVRKIRSYLLQQMLPPIVGLTVSELQRSRLRCFEILPLLNLDKEPLYRKVAHEEIEMKSDGTVRNMDLLRQLKA